METKKLIFAAAVLVTAAALPAAASGDVNAGSETATAGSVSAAFSWDAGEGPRNARLAIARAGATAFNAPIPRVCGEVCSLFDVDAEDFQVRDLDGDGEPEVVLNIGSDDPCCHALGVWDFQPATGTYREFSELFSSFLTIGDLNRDGRPEIKTSDARISGLPPRIFSYERTDAGPRLTDVTRRFPQVIRDDARFAKEVLTARDRPSVDSAQSWMSEYVADQYLLGRGEAGLKELDKQIRRGLLGERKEAKAFRKRLLRQLERFGYR